MPIKFIDEIDSDSPVTAESFIKIGGTSSQFLKADGSVDSSTYQSTLISGTNIKTINGSTILGSGNLVIDTTDQWGDIAGTLSNQTDLQNSLDDKQNILVSGTNIKTVGGTTILGSGNIPLGVTSIVAGTNVTISPVGGTGAVTINSSGITISPNVSNQVLTATGGSTISGESNFTFDGNTVIGGSSATITTSVVNQGVSGVYDDLNTWSTAYVSGEIMKGQSNGENVAVGECLVLTSGFSWMKSDQTSEEKAKGMLGIALQTSSANSGVDILIAGFAETTEVENTSATTGTPMYLAENRPGEVSDTIPASGFVRLVGYCYNNDQEQGNEKFLLRFDPDNTWVELG